jgi:hypothetical protein
MFHSNQFPNPFPVPPLKIFLTDEVSKHQPVEPWLAFTLCGRCSLLFKISNPKENPLVQGTNLW